MKQTNALALLPRVAAAACGVHPSRYRSVHSQPSPGTTSSSAAEHGSARVEAWWKRSQSQRGQCDKRLFGGCTGARVEQACTEDDCDYTARRCEGHGGTEALGAQMRAHQGRHRAERREREQRAKDCG